MSWFLSFQKPTKSERKSLWEKNPPKNLFYVHIWCLQILQWQWKTMMQEKERTSKKEAAKQKYIIHCYRGYFIMSSQVRISFLNFRIVIHFCKKKAKLFAELLKKVWCKHFFEMHDHEPHKNPLYHKLVSTSTFLWNWEQWQALVPYLVILLY